MAFGDAAAARPERAALGLRLAAYRFDRYRTKEPADKKPSVTKGEVACADPDKARAAFVDYAALADGVAFTRNLVSEPANILYPAEFARRVKELETLGLEVEILGEAEMAKLGMGSLLGVGQGSARESQLVVIRWNGAADPKAQPIAFVGKGVCFDTGLTARLSGRATWSPPCRVRPSRSSTPTPRAGSSWPTRSGTARTASSRSSWSIWRP